jgi:peptide/nickel transport system substrate-binding protein
MPLDYYPLASAVLYNDLATPYLSAGFQLELRKGVGPVVDRPISSARDVDALPAFDPREALAFNLYAIRILVEKIDVPVSVGSKVDFVVDPPFQDVAKLKAEGRFRLTQTSDIGTQYLGFDQSRDELQFSDVKGRNPFKDLRVRRAIYQAIDVDTIVAKVLRGQATPTGTHLSPLVDGHVPELEKRLPYDPAAARALLKEAGFADGFGVALDCVNIAYRAAVCQAIAGMLAQVGIRVTFQPFPTSTFFPRLTQATTSFFEFGWTPTTDAWGTLNAIVRSYADGGPGAFNAGRYANPKLDALVDAVRIEPDLAKRRRMVSDALRILNADLPLVPLYRRTLTWVMRPNVTAAQWPNDILELRFVQID